MPAMTLAQFKRNVEQGRYKSWSSARKAIHRTGLSEEQKEEGKRHIEEHLPRKPSGPTTSPKPIVNTTLPPTVLLTWVAELRVEKASINERIALLESLLNQGTSML